MKIIFGLALLIIFSATNEKVNVYAQKAEKSGEIEVQEKSALDKLLSAEEQEILKKADKLEGFLINSSSGSGNFAEKENQKLNEKDGFHGYKILKTNTISGEDKDKLVINLFNAIGKDQLRRCFSPRHGIRATYKGKTVELLICFECGHIYAFNGNGYKLTSIADFMN